MKPILEPTEYLDKKLTAYSKSGYYPFHMPGHKRHVTDFPNPYAIDITEIDGFDNLHHAVDILKEAQNRASSLYHTKESFFFSFGSTCGILSAISAALPREGTLLMGRNCHKAAYHAAFLRQLKTCYLMPEETSFGIMGSITPETVSKALAAHPEAKAVFLTSPTYDGVVSDIRTIADIVHAHNIPLIVDEAHGAHFRFSNAFPVSALECGADIVIHSVHKTLPCFTQTALLHVNSERIPVDTVKSFLDIYETSSPSYILMSSIEQGLRTMATEGAELMQNFTQLLNDFYQQAKQLKHLSVFTTDSCKQEVCFGHDFSKILISTKDTELTGQKLYDILLNKYHLQMEMASGHYVTALTSVMDTKEGFDRLIQALLEIDCNITSSTADTQSSSLTCQELYPIPPQALSISEALEKNCDTVPLADAIGCVSQEYIYLYPPGIPMIAPGEVLSEKLADNIRQCQKQGLAVEGLVDKENKKIRVVK